MTDKQIASAKPIIFQGWGVRAILSGEKTQTRRVLKGKGRQPYSTPGELLWLRETWKVQSFMEGEPIRIRFKADGYEIEDQSDGFTDGYEEWYERITIQSSDELIAMDWKDKDEDGYFRWDGDESPLRWRPSIHLPRYCARDVLLHVTDYREEAIQDISEEDAKAEGVDEWEPRMAGSWVTYYCRFSELWNSINEKRGLGWEENPRVGVTTFELVRP